MSNPNPLFLPCSPHIVCQDRFSILDTDELQVPFWAILSKILAVEVHDINSLIEQLETIEITLREESRSVEYGFLKVFLQNRWMDGEEARFFDVVWPSMVRLALCMPRLFPQGSIPALSSSQLSKEVFSRRQIACLVVHQFLCALPTPAWMDDSCSPDFHIWYSSHPPHPRAVSAYLCALFTYFELVADEEALGIESEWPITFELRSFDDEDEVQFSEVIRIRRFTPVEILHIPKSSTGPSLLGLPCGACVISANKNVGFGRSGTQEETQVGSSPESCPAVLFVPPLQDLQVLIVEGARAMISMTGDGREACLDQVLPAKTIQSCRMRIMIFMDALELDQFDSTYIVPDLLSGNIDRELKKAYTAFGSRREQPYSQIITGLWGCGAFCGNAEIKTIIQWCAAALRGVLLQFVCSGERTMGFSNRLSMFVDAGLSREWKVADVLDVIHGLDPSSAEARNAFEHVARALEAGCSILG